MEIRPIRNNADHAAALREAELLWEAAEGSPESDKLEVLALLIEDYEAKNWPIPQSSPAELLQYAVTEMGHSQSELASLLGSRSRASEILSGKRDMTLENIRKISNAWNIPAELLIGQYSEASAA